MVILHALAPGEIGGLERVVQSLAAGQSAMGHRVCVAVIHEPRAHEHPLTQRLRAASIEVVALPLPARAYVRERAAVAALCAELRPDVFHAHGYRIDVLDTGVARRSRIPVVTTVHGFTGGGWKNYLYERLQRRAFRSVDAVVTVSQPLREALIRGGVSSDRVHTIRNAWDGTVAFLDRPAARRQLGVCDEEFRIGWVGRLSQEKGPDVMLEALAVLRDAPVRLSMLGDGKGREGLRRRGGELSIDARITWHGTVDGAAALLPGFDVLVLSSRTEGTPMVLLEAMAAEVPVVATAVGGVPDVISSTEAVLVPPEDPTSLAAAIRYVVGDPDAARGRARAARRRLERDFAVQPWLEQYDTVYRAIQK